MARRTPLLAANVPFFWVSLSVAHLLKFPAPKSPLSAFHLDHALQQPKESVAPLLIVPCSKDKVPSLRTCLTPSLQSPSRQDHSEKEIRLGRRHGLHTYSVLSRPSPVSVYGTAYPATHSCAHQLGSFG